MAHFQRLIFCALVALFAWVPFSVYATIAAPSSGTLYKFSIGASVYNGFDSPASACSAAWPAYKTASGNTAVTRSQLDSPTACSIWSGSSFTQNVSISSYSGLVCPANSEISGASCVCKAGYSDIGGSCVVFVDPNIAKCAAVSGGLDMFSGHSSFSKFGAAYCPNDGPGANCGATVSGGFGVVKNGVTLWTYEVTYTGAVCVPPSGTPGVPSGATGGGAETTCKGTVGTFNGITTCVPLSKGDTNVVQSEKGGTSATGEKVTEETETKCTGTRCTTTTTTTTTPPTVNGVPGVPTSKTETKEEPKDDFCVKNPRSVMCVVSSLSAGACGSPDVCDGDAIQCAIQAMAKRTACALDPVDGGEKAALAAAKLVTGSVTGSLAGNTSMSLGPASFSSVELLSGSCIADRSVTVFSKTVTIPLSGVCPYLSILGQALVTVSFLAAAVIVFRG